MTKILRIIRDGKKIRRKEDRKIWERNNNKRKKGKDKKKNIINSLKEELRKKDKLNIKKKWIPYYKYLKIKKKKMN